NQVKAAQQLDPRLSGYPAIRTGAIQTIQALASLGKGLRINQAEINAAMNFDYPRVNDTQATALEKFRILGMMMDHLEKAALGMPPTRDESMAVVRAVNKLNYGTPAGPGPVRQPQPAGGKMSDEDAYRAYLKIKGGR